MTLLLFSFFTVPFFEETLVAMLSWSPRVTSRRMHESWVPTQHNMRKFKREGASVDRTKPNSRRGRMDISKSFANVHPPWQCFCKSFLFLMSGSEGVQKKERSSSFFILYLPHSFFITTPPPS